MKKTVPLAILGMGLALSACEKDDPTPQPEPVDNPPTTETVVSVQDEVNLVIENNNDDVDGDSTKTNFTVENERGEVVFNEDYDTKTIYTEIKNLPAGTYTVKTRTTANGKEATDTDTDTVEHQMQIEVTSNLEVNKENVKDGMPAGTEVATVNLEVEIDGQAQTVEELKAQGYVVIVTVDNQNQLKVVDDKKIVLAKDLDRDGEDGSDPEELKKLKGKVNVKVLKKDEAGNAVVVFENETDLDVEVEDVDDFVLKIDGDETKNKDNKPITLEENTKINEDYEVAERKFDRKEQVAINNADVENIINGGEVLFDKYVFESGSVVPQFKEGEHKGKLVNRGALEALISAVDFASTQNHPKVSGELKNIEETLGMILAQVKEWKVSYVNEDLGVTFMEPVNMKKIAGGTASEALKPYRNK